MNSRQYNNIVQHSLSNLLFQGKNDPCENVKYILKACGIALPHGDNLEILQALMSENYMGWHSCTHKQAQDFANEGTATIGIDENHIILITPDETALADTAAQTNDYVRTANSIAIPERLQMQFFASAYGTTGGTTTVPKPSTSKILSMPVNLNQKWEGNPPGIQKSGCAVCCAADVASYYDKSRNYTAQDLIDCGAASTSTIISWAKVPKAKITKKAADANYLSVIKSEINAGRPIILHNKNSGNKNQHWVVAYKYTNNASSDSDIHVLDPAGEDDSEVGAYRTLVESMEWNDNNYVSELAFTESKD